MWIRAKESGWWDSPLALWDLPIKHAQFPCLQPSSFSVYSPQGFLIFCYTLKFLNLQINDFKFPCILACGYEFHAITVRPHSPYLKHHLPHTPWFFTTSSRVEENLPTPWIRQRNLDLTSHSYSLTTPLINIRNRKIKYWSQPTTSFLWVKPWTKWCDSSRPWGNNILFSDK